MDNLFVIILKYVLFAVISIAVNLIFQFFSFVIYDGVGYFYIAMMTGTTAGLLCKYILDKKYIFYRKPINRKKKVTEFMFYSLTGVVTTLIFWGTEISFNIIFGGDIARYLGAFIGLSIGYATKFLLDKKYTFRVG
jgi:putative flippase GtrA